MFRANKKTPERRQWRCSVVFIVNFEHTSNLVLVLLLLILNMQLTAGIEAKTFLILTEFNSRLRWLIYYMRLELCDCIPVYFKFHKRHLR